MAKEQRSGLYQKEVMNHPDFPNKQCYFKKDNKNTGFYDQMILYAAIRKGREELRSNKLTYITNKEIGDEKLDYSEEGNIKKERRHLI